ncbi:MAG TPA: acylphosphatase [Methanothrix sp.]|nr:acylphosphatase [Methanothrix sp.]HOL43557.1 acylphosphatase [Methanothrix sp.]HPO89458.1 acylphosphatase [Methanothrix sp.]
MRRVEIIAKGDVQRVGYRDAVQNIARKLRLSGTVENVEPYDVRIVAEGEEAALKEFVNAVNIQERPIRVEELQVRWADATGEFQYFRILRGDWQEELGERFDVAIRYLQRSIELGEQNLAVGRENLSIGRMMLEKQDRMLEKQDAMLEKQDQMLEKQDAMLEKQDETIEELRGVRSDLREHMDKRFARIENEIAEIKRAIRELGGSCI